MTTMALDDYETELIRAVRRLPDEGRAAVLDAAREHRVAEAERASSPPPGKIDVDEEDRLDAWEEEYLRSSSLEMGLSAEETEDFLRVWATLGKPCPPGEALTGEELVRRLEEQEPMSDEAADELLEIIERDCGQIEWSSWDFPPGHVRDGGGDAEEPGGPRPVPDTPVEGGLPDGRR